MSSIFSQPAGGSLFGQNNQQQQNTTNPFGAATNNQNKSSLFPPLNTNTSSSQAPPGTGLFGSTSQAPAGTGLFGSTSQAPAGTGLFGSTTQAPAGTGLFGSTTQPQQTGSTFGTLGTTTNQQSQQTGGSLFGAQPQQNSMFGNLGATNNQQTQQQNQSQQGGGLFGGFGQNAQQQQQNQPQNQQQGSLIGQPRQFATTENDPPHKSVIHQMDLACQKWDPKSRDSAFQTYLYNTVPVEQAPFYGPTAEDNEAKWEEALAKKPSPGAVPVLAQGFESLGLRMAMQHEALRLLRGRLHEINEGLNGLLQKHDLEISIRAAECRRKHLRLSQRCLGLAAKTQILRNRGYAMDSAEEELRKKLMLLERRVFDPALNGRGEEIWARMVSVRERGRQLQREFEKAGTGMVQEGGKGVDEEVMAKTKKILEDYSSQLVHLTRELAQIDKDWAEWESSKPKATSNGMR